MDVNALANLLAMMRSQSATSEDVYSRDYVYDRNMKARESCLPSRSAAYATTITNTTVDAPNSSLPMVEIISQNLITLDDIVDKGPDNVHAGKFLLCRSIAPSWKINAINLVLDDPKGERALPLSLYNYRPKNFTKRSTDADLVPVGSIIVLMNPWLKYSASGFPALRCENPMHFCILDDSHPILNGCIWKANLPALPPDLTDFGSPTYDNMEPAKAGLCYLADKKYAKAVESYSKAIEADSKNVLLYANRAAAYLALDKPSLALADADKGLEIEPSNLKLLFRKGKALYALKRYGECLDFLKKDVKRGSIPEIASLFNDVQLAYRESKTGKYDLLKIIEEAEKNTLLEHAEFFDFSLVEIQPVAGCERGLVAAKDIPAGTLICAVKAFAYRKATLNNIQIDVNKSRKCVDIGNSELLATISDKLLDNPSLGHEFYKLYAGEKLRWLEQCDESNPIDIERIQEIIRNNAFSAGNNDLGLDSDLSKYVHDSGVWILPSYINHSCTEINCVHPIFGDFMFVRTIKNIQKGSQLLFQYCPPTTQFEERDEALRGSYGFVCNCRLCLLESAESAETRQALRRIKSDYDTAVSSKAKPKSKSKSKKKGRSVDVPDHSDEIRKLTSLLDETRSLRQDQSLNLLACEIADSLAFLYLQQRQFKEAIEHLEQCFKLYEDFGLSMKALDAAHGLVLCYGQLNQKVASSWDQKARSLARLMFGDEKMLAYLQKIHSA